MGSKANAALIGAFVVGALALAVIGVLVFGSGQFFQRKTRVACFFSGDVSGLNVGAPVKFKGVEIGSVADIRLRLSEETAELNAEAIARGIRIPTLIEIDNDKLTMQGAKAVMDRIRLKQLIDLGLRAQLVSQSLVTGLLLVQLDFHPDLPATFVLPADSALPEIPTIPTTMERVQSAAQDIIRKLEDMHFERLVNSATEAVDTIRNMAQSPGLQTALERLPETVANVNETVTVLRALSVQIDRGQGPLLQSLKGTSDKTGQALEQARATLESLQMLLNPNAALAVQLSASLQQVAEAARSVRLLADFLERDPSAIVRGRDVKEK